MAKRKPNFEALFLEARRLLEEEDRLHANGCGCRDKDPIVEGPCPGVKERVAFLKKTAKYSEHKK